MPIPGIEQPAYITVSDNIRLHKSNNNYDFAFECYGTKKRQRYAIYLLFRSKIPRKSNRQKGG